MGNEIDTSLFLEIIQSEEGIYLLRIEESYLPEILYVFKGLAGKKVTINATEEYISKVVAIHYLNQLGLSYLLERGLLQ